MIADALDPVDPYIEDILVAFRAFKRAHVRDEEYQEQMELWQKEYGKVGGGINDHQHNNDNHNNKNNNNQNNNRDGATVLTPTNGDVFEEEMYQLAVHQKEDEERKRRASARKKHEGKQA